jgi:hypothetical protein
MKSYDVFLSHSARDKEFVRRLCTDLESFGYRVCVDETYLTLGDILSSRLEEAIRESRFLAVVHSLSSVGSIWVKRECAYAKEQGVPVVPVVLEKVAIDDQLSGQIYADFTQPTDQHAYHRAFHDLLRMLGRSVASPRELTIYSSGLARGWLNSSWEAICTERFQWSPESTCCFRAVLSDFGGIAFVFRSGVDTSPFSRLDFALHGGDLGGQKLKVFFNDRIGNGILNQYPLEPLPAGTWLKVSVPLEDLGAEHTIIFKVNWSHAHDDLSGPVYLADVRMVA